MIVTLLVDNLADGDLRSEHGLSILVETENGSVLFDTGQTDAWLANARLLGAEISAIRAVALSHGHYDHTGGLETAMRVLEHAVCYAHPSCFEDKYARDGKELIYIGVPGKATVPSERMRYNRGSAEILPGIMLSGEIPLREGDGYLQKRFLTDGDESFVLDTFEDEQCLVACGQSGIAVLLGCAHRGVENNLLAAMELASTDRMKLVLGGFHLGDADERRLSAVADFFEGRQIETVACCHCTGLSAYEHLRDRLGEKVVLARAGMTWKV